MNTHVIFGQPSVSVLGLKKIYFSVISGCIKCTSYAYGNSYSTISQIKDWINYGGWNKFQTVFFRSQRHPMNREQGLSRGIQLWE